MSSYPDGFTPAKALRNVEFLKEAYNQFYNFRYDELHQGSQPPLPFQVPYNYRLLWDLWGLDIDPSDLENLLGKNLSPQEVRELWVKYGDVSVPFGYAAVSPDNTELVIAVRGTEQSIEFIEDLFGLGQSLCPVPGSKGMILQAASLFYQTLAWIPAGQDKKAPLKDGLPESINFLKDGWPELNIPELTSCVITGHSLGACLILPLAVDWALNGPAKNLNPAVYSFASPRVGNPTFARFFDNLILYRYRVANRPDIPPYLPPKLYWFPTSWRIWSPKSWKIWHCEHVKHKIAVGPRRSIVWLLSLILAHWGLWKFSKWFIKDIGYNHSLAAYEKGLQDLRQW